MFRRLFSGGENLDENGETPFDPANYSYRAFLSYARADVDVVDDLYNRLTRYRTPSVLRKKQTVFGTPPRALRIFLDRKSVEAGGSVPDRLRDKLRSSAFLIVFCSHQSKDRHWVNQEIQEFLKTATPDRIIPVFLREDLETELDAITPPSLHELGDMKPLGADLVLDGGMRAVRDKVIGGLIGVPQDQIAREQERADKIAKRRGQIIFATIFSLLMISVASAFAVYKARNAALLSESRQIARQATDIAITGGDPDRAMLLSLEALPRKSARFGLFERPFEARAAGALATSMFWRAERKIFTYEEISGVWGPPLTAVSPDGKLFATAYGPRLKVYESAHGNQKAELNLSEDDGNTQSIQFSPDNAKIAVATDKNKLFVYSIADETVTLKTEKEGNLFDDAIFSPDGRDILILRWTNPFVMDAASGETKFELSGHESAVYKAGYSADGRLIYTLSGDHTVGIWSATSGERLATLASDEFSGFDDLAISPDGAVLYTSERLTLRRWSLPDGVITHTQDKPSEIRRLALSSDGLVLAMNEGETVILRNAADLSTLAVLKGHTGDVTSVAFSADNKFLVSVSIDETIRVWDLATLDNIGTYRHRQKPFKKASFAGGANAIVAAALFNEVWYLPALPNTPALTLSGHINTVEKIAYSPDGKYLVSGSDDFTARLWDAETGELIRKFGEGIATQGGPITTLAFSPDGKRVMTGGDDGYVVIWDIATGADQFYWRAPDLIRDARFSPDGKRIIVVSKEYPTAVIDIETETEALLEETSEDGAYGAMFSPDGALIMSYDPDGKIKLWRADTLEFIRTIDAHASSVTNAKFNKDGSKILSMSGGGGEGVALLIDAQTGELLARYYPQNDVIWNAEFTPDESRIVTASADSTAKVWDTKSGSELLEVASDQRSLSDVAISPDGSMFVTVAYLAGPSAILWNIDTGQPIARYFGQGSTITDVAFAPQVDGKPMRFATAGDDGTIRIWNAPRSVNDPALIGDACDLVVASGRQLTPQEATAAGLTWRPKSRCAPH